VGFTLCCVEREAEDFSPGMHLTGYTWQLKVAFFQGLVCQPSDFLVWCFLKEESLFIFLLTKSLSYSVISAIVFCFTDAYKGLLLLLCLERKITPNYKKIELRKISSGTKFTLPPQTEHICSLLGYYATGSGNFLQTFRDNLSVAFSEVKNPS
jgi:hypothetical protein